MSGGKVNWLTGMSGAGKTTIASSASLKLCPFLSSPVLLGPFAWSRSLLFKGF